MARRVFFSFHYERDIWRANVVRNSWVTQTRAAAGFWDASLWEEAKRKGDEAIKRMIRDGLRNTSVTVVLIGTQTARRPYVRYEILQSVLRGNGLLGVHINQIENRLGLRSPRGPNPFDLLAVPRGGRSIRLSTLYPVYDWVRDDGYRNLGTWIARAARKAAR